MPPQSAIPSSIRTMSSTGAPPHSHRLSSIPGEATPNPSIPSQASIGYGIPSVPAKVKEKILAGEYIDFTELPPAKGKLALLPSTLSTSEGSLLLINSADLHQVPQTIHLRPSGVDSVFRYLFGHHMFPTPPSPAGPTWLHVPDLMGISTL